LWGLNTISSLSIHGKFLDKQPHTTHFYENRALLLTLTHSGTVDTLTMTCSHPDELAAYMMSSPTYANTSDTAPGQIWTTQGTVAHLCKERNHMNGSYVGTAFTARDLITVVDALGEDGMLRFWGKSLLTTQDELSDKNTS
jgi:hypothetical protein